MIGISQSTFSISLCIATHERAFLLGSTLDAIACQTRLPDEIIISDSSRTPDSELAANACRQACPHLQIKYVKSGCKALPWHRWNGYQHSQGDIVLFLDDDITLMPNALQMLEKAYCDLISKYGIEHIAGVGFYVFLDDGTEFNIRRPASFEERWLGIVNAPSASITPGGLGVPPRSMPKNALVEVERFSGGGMSFRRAVLEKIGYLDNLTELYNRRIGRSEDRVLSHYARLHGRLFMLTNLLVVHPKYEKAIHSVTVNDGWHHGLIETWGRAYTMRWIATDGKAYRRDWFRVATLELLRAIWWGVLRRPYSPQSWARLAGALYGIGLTLTCWKWIPPMAKS